MDDNSTMRGIMKRSVIGQIQILSILGDFPGSLYDRNLLSDNKSLNMLKTYPWEEPHEIFQLLCG